MLHVSFTIPLVAMGWCALVGAIVVLAANLSQLRHEEERNLLRYSQGYQTGFVVTTLIGTAVGAAFMALLAFIIYSILAAG